MKYNSPVLPGIRGEREEVDMMILNFENLIRLLMNTYLLKADTLVSIYDANYSFIESSILINIYTRDKYRFEKVIAFMLMPDNSLNITLDILR